MNSNLAKMAVTNICVYGFEKKSFKKTGGYSKAILNLFKSEEINFSSSHRSEFLSNRSLI